MDVRAIWVHVLQHVLQISIDIFMSFKYLLTSSKYFQLILAGLFWSFSFFFGTFSRETTLVQPWDVASIACLQRLHTCLTVLCQVFIVLCQVFVALLLALCVIYIQNVSCKQLMVFDCLILILQDSHEEGSNTPQGVGRPGSKTPYKTRYKTPYKTPYKTRYSCILVLSLDRSPRALTALACSHCNTQQHIAKHGNTRQHNAI